jgi:hypothetical protein
VRTIVVLTETELNEHDITRIGELYGPDAFHAVVVLPVGDDRNAITEAVEDVALGRLDDALRTDPGLDDSSAAAAALRSASALQSAGWGAEAMTAPADPIDTVAALVGERDVEQVLVLTEPHPVETTLRRDWGSRLHKKVQVPVLHAISGTDRVIR